MKAKAQAETAAKKAESNVSVRPHEDAWGFVVILLFMGGLIAGTLRALPQHPPSSAPFPWPIALAWGALFVIPAALLAAYLLRARVTAAETGLKTRGLFGEKETPWADIADFYTLPIPYRRSKEPNYLGRDTRILDRNGRIAAAFNSQVNHASDLKAVVVKRAMNTQTRSWHIKGARPSDSLPRVFAYDTRENRATLTFVAAQCFVAVALIGSVTVSWIYNSLIHHDFGWWTLAGAGVTLLLGGVPVLLFVIIIDGRKANMRAGERFTVDADGFTFCAPNRSEHVLWKNVTGYGYAPRKPNEKTFAPSYFPPCRIETVAQGAFDFTALIGDVMVLREIVRVNAVNANQTDWPDVPPIPDESQDGARRNWSSGVEGVGERIFHYRTDLAHLGLLMASAFPAIGGSSAIFTFLGLTRASDPTPELIIFALSTPFFLLALWRYYAAQIRVGEAGITQTTPWGQTHIAWADVQSVTLSGEPFGAKIVGANGRVIRWTTGLLAGEAELRALLAERVPPA